MIVKYRAESAQIDKDLSKLEQVEIWDTVYGRKSNRKLGNLVPMRPDHFAERKASGAFKRDAIGRPFYYTRTDTGIEFHPSCNTDYWLEPVFSK